MPAIGELSVVLTAVTGPFIKGVGRAGGALGSLRCPILSVRGAVTGLAAVGGVSAFSAWVKSSLSAGDALAKQADALGTTTERLQAMFRIHQAVSTAGVKFP